MSSLNQIIWPIMQTRPFNRMLPRIFRSQVYQLKGKTKPNGSVLSTVVFGRIEAAEYFSKLVYIEPIEVKPIQRMSLNQFSSFIEKINADLAFLDSSDALSSFITGKGFFVLPSIDLVLDLKGSLEFIHSRFSESKRRKIKQIEKDSYTYEITKDPEKIKLFYNEIYLPNIRSRHDKSARPVSFQECERLFLKGFLLLGKLNTEYISGAVLVPNGDELYFPLIGTKEIQGSVSIGSHLMYNQTIIWGKQNGFKAVDFGNAPPFLRDGLLLWKKSWGMRIRLSRRTNTNILALKCLNLNKEVTDFLSSNPFVFVKDSRLNGLLSLSQDVDDIGKISIRGLSDLFVISQGLDPSVCEQLKLQKMSSAQYDQMFSSQTEFAKSFIEKGNEIYRLIF
jgi:hypothetical protein